MQLSKYEQTQMRIGKSGRAWSFLKPRMQERSTRKVQQWQIHRGMTSREEGSNRYEDILFKRKGSNPATATFLSDEELRNEKGRALLERIGH